MRREIWYLGWEIVARKQGINKLVKAHDTPHPRIQRTVPGNATIKPTSGSSVGNSVTRTVTAITVVTKSANAPPVDQNS